MTNVAIWCRHLDDNIIGIGNDIPWNVQSDTEHFRDIVNEQYLVCGRKTYETLPADMHESHNMFVMTNNLDYVVTNAAKHKIILNQKKLADLECENDLYIIGGAAIYELFLTGKECLKPHIIVDCVYDGELNPLQGERIDISKSIDVMKKKYRPITPAYCLDNVASTIWVKKGEFVEQSVLKRIVCILEKGAEIS